jgi:hypothetical protein
VEGVRALAVIVVAECDEEVGGVARLEGLDGGAEAPLRVTADTKVADGDESNRLCLTRVSRAGQHQHEAE